MTKKKPVSSKKSAKNAVVASEKAADSPEKHLEKPVIPSKEPIPELVVPDGEVKLPDSLPPGYVKVIPKEPSLFERKVELLRVQFGKSEKMHSEKQINTALSLRMIELLEEIRDGIHSR